MSNKKAVIKNQGEEININDVFKVADLYFSKKFIMYSHNYNSFNKFLDVDIKEFLTNNGNVFFDKITNNEIIKYKFKFEDIQISPPMIESTNNIMWPRVAREQQYTYASKLSAKVTQIQEIRDAITYEIKSEKAIGESDNNVVLATIPIMVKSKYCSLNLYNNEEENNKECDFDPGCYFIVNGSEKVVIPQERMIRNKPLIFAPKNSAKDYYEIQVNSESPNKDGSMQVMRVIYNKNTNFLTLRAPIFEEFPIIILFRIMGLETDKDIINSICYDKNNTNMIEIVLQSIRLTVDNNGNKIDTKEKAINYLIDKIKINRDYSDNPEIKKQQQKILLLSLLQNNFLPHIPNSTKEKILYIGYMINKLLNCALGIWEFDDRDSCVNKRIDLVGDLLHQLFRQNFKKMLNECKNHFKRRNNGGDEKPINIINSISANVIEKGLNVALATGTFGMNPGIAQSLPRMTYMQEILILRRIDSPSNEASASKMFKPRMYHPTQNGMLCPVETPEHANVGLTKQLSLVGNVTVDNSTQKEIIKEIIKNKYTKLIQFDNITLKQTKIFLNGEWLGYTNKAYSIYELLKKNKYEGKLEYTTSISLNDIENELYIWCDGGRLYRPTFRVENNKLLLTKEIINEINSYKSFDEFMIKNVGVIEFIDCDEQLYALVAPTINDVMIEHSNIIKSKEVAKNGKEDIINRYNEYTFKLYSHCEIHPSLLIGLIASTIPFVNHNNGARSILHYAQGKQAIGIYASNYKYRFDNAYLLYHPQKPLLSTRASKYSYYDILSPGENVTIAVMCYTGFNQEDSIIINQAALDRGLFRSTTFEKKMLKITKNQSTSIEDIFTKPDPAKVSGMSNGNYDKLNDRGFIPEESIIENNDIIMGKISSVQPTETNSKIYRDSSMIYKHYLPAVVDKVWNNVFDSDSYEAKKMRIRSERIPMIGDKFSTKSAQKGTIGLILPQEDMPFTENGIVPDIIFNPSSVYGRMTMGFILECLFGKTAALYGCEYDATGFDGINIEEIQEKLKQLNFEENGRETLYNGITGEQIQVKIFTGCMYYLALKHKVADKIHARSTGPKTTLVRQPAEGRSRQGGLRIGEMERDGLIAHGASAYTKEKLLDVSDKYEAYVCGNCGMFAQRTKKETNKFYPTSADTYFCQNCQNKTNISKVAIPYAFKLLTQELLSMGVAPKIKIQE